MGEVGDPRSSGRGGSGATRPARASGRVEEVSPRRPISPSMRSSRSSRVDEDLPSRHFTAPRNIPKKALVSRNKFGCPSTLITTLMAFFLFLFLFTNLIRRIGFLVSETKRAEEIKKLDLQDHHSLEKISTILRSYSESYSTNRPKIIFIFSLILKNLFIND